MRKTFILFLIILISTFLANAVQAEEKNDNIGALKKIDENLESIKKSPEAQQIGIIAPVLKDARRIYEFIKNSFGKIFYYAKEKLEFLKNLTGSKDKAQNVIDAGKKERDKLFEDNGFQIKKYIGDKINLILNKN